MPPQTASSCRTSPTHSPQGGAHELLRALYATVWFIVWVICLWLVWLTVDRKDLNRALWTILCISFPVIILIVVALLPPNQRPTPPEMLP